MKANVSMDIHGKSIGFFYMFLVRHEDVLVLVFNNSAYICENSLNYDTYRACLPSSMKTDIRPVYKNPKSNPVAHRCSVTDL